MRLPRGSTERSEVEKAAGTWEAAQWGTKGLLSLEGRGEPGVMGARSVVGLSGGAGICLLTGTSGDIFSLPESHSRLRVNSR